MNLRNFLQSHIEQLLEAIAKFAARFTVGKLRRLANLWLLFVFMVGGVIVGLGGLSLSLVFHASPLVTFGYASFAVLFTVCPLVGWCIIRGWASQVEAELATTIQDYGHRATDPLWS